MMEKGYARSPDTIPIVTKGWTASFSSKAGRQWTNNAEGAGGQTGGGRYQTVLGGERRAEARAARHLCEIRMLKTSLKSNKSNLLLVEQVKGSRSRFNNHHQALFVSLIFESIQRKEEKDKLEAVNL